VACDHLITWGATEFEHETPKIFQLSSSMVALMAGDALRASKILRPNITNANPDPRTAEEVANQIAASYACARDHQLEVEVFRPRGLTRAAFYEKGLPQILGNAAFQIDQVTAQYNLGVSILVGGVDTRGAHLFDVSNPGGNAVSFQQIGFQATGMGQIHALQSLIQSKHSSICALAQTVFAVYIAKRRAEVAPGVGTQTDLAIVSASGTRKLTPDELNMLEQNYQKLSAPLSADILKSIEASLNPSKP
jgi:20S proteasome alpha/beta subunit